MVHARSAIAALALLVFALASAWAAPVRAQAKQPDQPRLSIRPRTPALVGPDRLERAIILIVTPAGAELQGQRVTPRTLAGALRTLLEKYKKLQPNTPFDGRFIVACAPETSIGVLARQLETAAVTGYPNPSFLFIKKTAPGAGAATDQLTVADATTSTSKATPAADPKAITLAVREFPDCLALSRALVAKRNEGHAVRLDLEGAVPPRR
jgi:hypothetical protein